MMNRIITSMAWAEFLNQCVVSQKVTQLKKNKPEIILSGFSGLNPRQIQVRY